MATYRSEYRAQLRGLHLAPQMKDPETGNLLLDLAEKSYAMTSVSPAEGNEIKSSSSRGSWLKH